MTKKVCTKCEFNLDLSNFYRRSNGRYYAACIYCTLEDNKKRADKNRDKYNKDARDRRQARKVRAVEYKGGKCEHCDKEYHVAAFDFHHTNPSEKESDPGLLMGASDEVLFKELDKCILLCSNCHRIHHYEEGNLGEIRARKNKS